MHGLSGLISFLLGVGASLGQDVQAPSLAGNLPAQKIGSNDLLSISVYGAPELTRTVRVSAEGFIRLPMLKQKVEAKGLMPSDLEAKIAAALDTEKILVEPVVTVTIAEYHSRPISVAGAVKLPLTFQALGQTTLLEALTRAQGLSSEAGTEILVTRPPSSCRWSASDRKNSGKRADRCGGSDAERDARRR